MSLRMHVSLCLLFSVSFSFRYDVLISFHAVILALALGTVFDLFEERRGDLYFLCKVVWRGNENWRLDWRMSAANPLLKFRYSYGGQPNHSIKEVHQKNIIYLLQMQQINIKPIQHYNQLIHRLKPRGIYQIRLVALMALYWFLSGLNESIFELTLRPDFTQLSCYIQEIFCIVAMISATLLSLHFPRNKVNSFSVGLIMLGSILLALGSNFDSKIVTLIGEFLVVMMHYSVSVILMMIVVEYYQLKHFPTILLIALLFQTVGRLVAVWIHSADISVQQWSVVFLLPTCLVYVISALTVTQTPRYWIDTNIIKAQKLLHSISHTNHLKHQPIEQLLQRHFFWHKVTLTKYSFSSLTKHKSVSFNTYILCIEALMLGLICRCPDFIQHLRSKTSFTLDDSFSITWVSSFQLFALIPAYLSSSVLNRKTLIMTLTTILLLLFVLLSVLQLGQYTFGNAILLDMAIFGLSSFFSMILFYSLILLTLELYPHTVRTLAVGIVFSMYLLGKLLFTIHIDWLQKDLGRDQGMVELMLCCTLVMLLHCFMLEETFNSCGRYDLSELEKRQYQQN